MVVFGQEVEDDDEDVVHDAARAVGAVGDEGEGFLGDEISSGDRREDNGDEGDVECTEDGCILGGEFGMAGLSQRERGDRDVEGS